ncbi:TetR/AcrR family transcriptional regulator [Actinospica sp. MGRD01-02]|uniref:TetR/AcrR family transcriptional regulator n=1 Tax=Actinospica acidithermotolerans TaxID=2828514 RepID=A0A941IMR1_9ACTN|nr:TetR/AcrR family transcriptional regulator [Actinospica acidithermotolerans]MBR7828791.1 TetR/AcrR family transcriptional regulator [Actinospica acidithermotolerans]
MTSAYAVHGRIRTTARHDELCRAALELLSELGYDRLTMDAVAARAGAGKATLYRRWTGKASMVADALSRMKAIPDEVDTGSLRGDLVAMTCGFGAGDDPFQTGVTAGLVSALVHDAELRDAFAEHFLAPRKRMQLTAFERAVRRGEIPPQQDFDLLAGVLPAMVFHRMMTTGQAPDADFALTVIDRVLLPLAHQPGPRRAPAPPDPAPPEPAPTEPIQTRPS